MSGMIERVAKAMHKEFVRVTSPNFPPGFARETWETTAPHVRDFYRSSARAGIEAMREPTEAMLTAGWKGLPPPRPYDLASFRKGFTAAIDAALSVSDEHSQSENAKRSRGEALPARSSERGDALPLSSHGEEKKGGGE